jgi:hypothetical protein
MDKTDAKLLREAKTLATKEDSTFRVFLTGKPEQAVRERAKAW